MKAGPVLTGTHVRLEPLTANHARELESVVATTERQTFSFAIVPSNRASVEAVIADRLRLADKGLWLPYVQIRASDSALVGLTNFLAIERWDGPDAHPTSVEIGGTFLIPSAQRTPINTEAKYLLLSHAFDTWGVIRVQIKTDERNERSRRAIERLGAQFEGVLRRYQPGQGEQGSGAPRNTAMYSILNTEWPTVKAALEQRLTAAEPKP